jgi:HK97 family phage portal protein
MHMKFFDPCHDFYGLSPLAVAKLAIASDSEARLWNHALLKNDARPPGALVTASTLGEDTFKRVKDEILENYQGAANARRPMLLEGGLDWKQFAFSPADLDFLEGLKATRADICAIYGVPPELVGAVESKTYNSCPEARSAFYQETVLPLLDRMRDEFNANVTSRFGDRLWLDYDRDQIEALQEDQDKLWARVDKATSLTLNEKREALGYETYEDAEADIPAALLNKPPAVDPDVDPDTGEPAVPEKNDDPAEAKGLRAPNAKELALTAKQQSARARLRKLLRRHFGAEGQALVKHIERALNG